MIKYTLQTEDGTRHFEASSDRKALELVKVKDLSMRERTKLTRAKFLAAGGRLLLRGKVHIFPKKKKRLTRSLKKSKKTPHPRVIGRVFDKLVHLNR